MLLTPCAGFQGDEVAFVYSLWHPETSMASISIFHHRMPLMMMSYLGSLKSWIFTPIFRLFGVSEWSVRVPAILLASATILLGGLLIRRSGGRLAAVLFIWLLSTDIIFLLTAVFDWGPVVIQNLLLVAGILSFATGWSNRRNWMLFAGGLLFGMALWDKALFFWNLTGMIAALLLVNPRALFQAFTGIRFWLAVVGLMIGASPLLRFNVLNDAATLKDNTRLALNEIAPKADYLKLTLEGTLAENPFADEQYQVPEQRKSWFDKTFAAWVTQKPIVLPSWRWWLLLSALPIGLLLGSASQRRWILFFAISAGVSWFQSALTVGAGHSIHHSVLIWPLLYSAIALSLSAIAHVKAKYSTPCVLVVIGIFLVRGVLMMGFTYENMRSSARVTQWTDADKVLGEQLLRRGLHRALCADWGIAWVVAARTGDKIAVSDLFFDLAGGHFNQDRFVNCSEPDCAVIDHVKDRALDPKAHATLENSLDRLGLKKVDYSIVRDSRSIPIFELYRIRRSRDID
jgi:4-amino-4-deoxy-L-arabinose transferase-like glycosyltransferase